MLFDKNNRQPPPSPPYQHHDYTAIPSHPLDQNYTVLRSYYPDNPSYKCWMILTVSLILLLPAFIYIFWPSDPDLKIQRLQLIHVHIHTKPVLCIDLSLSATLKVHNADVYSMDYKNLDVAVGYRGKKVGHVRSEQGRVRALGTSYVDAELELKCVKVLSDVVFLLEDLAKGTVSFDTVTEVTGRLGIFFFEFPLKAKVSCEILLNTKNQTIVNQDCYPKVRM